jgi:outer membrane immunogenic protein
MKRILIGGAFALLAGGQALAADLPPPMAPPPRAPATYVPVIVPGFSWTGIYVGINGGYNFGTATPNGLAGLSENGFLIGGTLGGNYQFGSFVIGLEGDGDYNSMSQNNFKSTWLATVRGRAGFAYDRVLFYGTGGAAFANAQVTGLGSTTMDGWTAGGGIEWAFTPNWTAKAEYLYADFPTPSIGGNSFKFTDNIIRAGINFKFW